MKNLKITVNGTTYDVQVEEPDIQNKNFSNNTSPQTVNPLINSNNQQSFIPPAQTSNVSELCSIKAPMPGTIVSINVNENQKISKGDVILILEAMKMENEIMAPDDITISKISVKQGESVETGQDLILYK